MDQGIIDACDELARKFQLSRAERNIIQLIASDKTPIEIAVMRERSISTVRSQIKQIMHKMGVHRYNSILIEVLKAASHDGSSKIIP